MSMPSTRHWTYAEYLALELETNTRHEYVDGEVYAMSGGTLRHSRLKMNVGTLLHLGLRGGRCAAFDSDAKVRVLTTGVATYADFSVVCGSVETHPEDRHALTNPTALFEVLSPTTESWDRGGKFRHAQQIPSLKLYVLVSQDEPMIEVYERVDDGWLYTAHPAGFVALRPLGIELSVDEIYADLPEEPAPTEG